MHKSEYFEDGKTPEEMYEPTIKHFSEGNGPESVYDKPLTTHSDDDYCTNYFDDEPTIKHFQD